MYKELKVRLLNQLKAEADYVEKFEKDKTARFEKFNDIMNITKVLDNYEDIEPVVAKAINELAYKKKFEQEDR